MRRPRGGTRALAAAIAALAVAAAAAVALLLIGDGGGGGGSSRIEVIESRRLDSRLHEVTMRTPSIGAEVGVRVLLPAGYERSRSEFPVLYLLHPATGDRRFWTDTAGVAALAKNLDAIVVMPDGGARGFYSDWQENGDRPSPRWESFHVDELIPWVDSEFRTVESADGRAVAGASMGGLGALMYAARHPDLFGVTASFSGPAELRPETMNPLLRSVRMSPALAERIWGDPETDLENWVRHDPVSLAGDLRGVEVILHVGNGRPIGYEGPLRDPIELKLFRMNLRLHERLAELGIRHEWSPGIGAHNLSRFRTGLARTLPRIAEVFDARSSDRLSSSPPPKVTWPSG